LREVWSSEEAHNNAINDIAITPNGNKSISASTDTTLKVWDIDRGFGIHRLRGHELRVDVVKITPDGTCAISASADSRFKIWNLNTGSLSMDILDNPFNLPPFRPPCSR